MLFGALPFSETMTCWFACQWHKTPEACPEQRLLFTCCHRNKWLQCHQQSDPRLYAPDPKGRPAKNKYMDDLMNAYMSKYLKAANVLTECFVQ